MANGLLRERGQREWFAGHRHLAGGGPRAGRIGRGERDRRVARDTIRRTEPAADAATDSAIGGERHGRIARTAPPVRAVDIDHREVRAGLIATDVRERVTVPREPWLSVGWLPDPGQRHLRDDLPVGGEPHVVGVGRRDPLHADRRHRRIDAERQVARERHALTLGRVARAAFVDVARNVTTARCQENTNPAYVAAIRGIVISREAAVQVAA